MDWLAVGGALAIGVVIVVVVWLVAASQKVRRLDERVYESKAGWFMPGGIFWKLGRRDDRTGERKWPYLFGLPDGWMYNAGRERRAQKRARGE